MKNSLLLSLAILMLAFAACTNTDDDNSSNSGQPQQVEDDLVAGDWKITYFNDSGDDETSDFSGYSFSFEDNGTITATKNNNTYTGTWSIADSNSNDDSPDDLDFNIFFNQTNELEELNEDWHFISQSDTKIELIHISGGNGGTDYVTFEKI
jgi:hypothetical protein